jgi:hypothetical protein
MVSVSSELLSDRLVGVVVGVDVRGGYEEGEGISSNVGCDGLRRGGGVRKWAWFDVETMGTLDFLDQPPFLVDPINADSARDRRDTLRLPSCCIWSPLLALMLSTIAS